MLDKLLRKLFEDLDICDVPMVQNEGVYLLKMDKIEVQIVDKGSAIFCYADLALLSDKKRGETLSLLMEANFLGQGTGAGVIGLREDTNFLTFSLNLSCLIDYVDFKNILETFINYVEYWKDMLAQVNRLIEIH